jgi:hypothetical protein
MSFHAFIETTAGENGQLKAIFNVYDDGKKLYVDELNAAMVHEEVEHLEARLKETASPASEKALRRQLTEFRKAAMRMPKTQNTLSKDGEFLYDGLIPDPHAPDAKEPGPTKDPHAPKRTMFA